MLGWLTSLQLQIFVYIGICMFLAFKWCIKDKNRLRMEGERNLFTKALFVSRYKPTLGYLSQIHHKIIKLELFDIAWIPNHFVYWNLHCLSFQMAYQDTRSFQFAQHFDGAWHITLANAVWRIPKTSFLFSTVHKQRVCSSFTHVVKMKSWRESLNAFSKGSSVFKENVGVKTSCSLLWDMICKVCQSNLSTINDLANRRLH